MPSVPADELSTEELQERSLKGYIKLGYVALIFWPFLLFAALLGSYSSATGARTSNGVALAFVLLAPGLPFVTHIIARLQSDAGRYKLANRIAALPMTLIAALFGLALVWVIVMDILIKLHV